MKKNLAKVVSGFLALTFITALAAGCSNSSTKKETQSGSTATTTINVWTANRSDAQYVQDKISTYNKTNKDGVEIKYSIYSDNFQQSLELAYATNAEPDVYTDTGDFFVKHLSQGYFLNLNKYLTADYKKRFGDSGFINGINVIDGKTYSLPALGSTPRLVYNEDIFRQVGISATPKSLAEMVADAKLISEKLKSSGVYGFAANMKSPSSFITRSIVQILELSGSPIKEGYNFKDAKYDFTPYKPILQAFNQIFTSDAAFPGCESLDIDPLRAQFSNGKIGMYISWTHAEPAVYQNQFQTKENWSMAALPTINGTVTGSQDILLADKWYYIDGKTKNADKAFKALQFFYSDDFLKGYYENGLGIVTVPSVLKIAAVPDTVKKIPELKLGTTDQVWPILPSGVAAEGQNYYQVFSSLMFTNQSMDTALNDLNSRYNSAYSDAVSAGTTKKIQYKTFNPATPSKVLEK
jgi:multiple sugar transport system substrate-binding protein